MLQGMAEKKVKKKKKNIKDRLEQKAGGLWKGYIQEKGGLRRVSNWTENLKITEDMLKATSTREKERQPETSVKIKCCSKKEI